MDSPLKPAPVSGVIIDPIRFRWSPRAFDDRPVAESDLQTILTAAQWAPSTYNEQEWRYLIARRQDGEQFAQALGCLTEANQRWARAAAVLMFCVGRTTFARNGKPNPVWHYDCGLASALMVTQAMALGIYVHQMAGIMHDQIRRAYNVPAEFEPLAGIALGYMGQPDSLPDDLKKAELSQRTRRPLSETVFAETWGKTGI